MCHKKQKYLVLGASAPYPTLDHATPTASHAYPQLLEYMGLELTEEEIRLNKFRSRVAEHLLIIEHGT